MISEAELKTWSKVKLKEWLRHYEGYYQSNPRPSYRRCIQQIQGQLNYLKQQTLWADERKLCPWSTSFDQEFQAQYPKVLGYMQRKRIPVEVLDDEMRDDDGLPTLQIALRFDGRLEGILSYRYSPSGLPRLYIVLENGHYIMVWDSNQKKRLPALMTFAQHLLMIDDANELLLHYPSRCK